MRGSVVFRTLLVLTLIAVVTHGTWQSTPTATEPTGVITQVMAQEKWEIRHTELAKELGLKLQQDIYVPEIDFFIFTARVSNNSEIVEKLLQAKKARIKVVVGAYIACFSIGKTIHLVINADNEQLLTFLRGNTSCGIYHKAVS